jgi:DNA-binding NarL/FixJ family response regulator
MKHEKRFITGSRIQGNQPTRKLTLLEAYSLLGSSECRVLKKMAEGKSNRQISEELFISLKTVENHITNIGNKLQIKGWGRLRKWLQDVTP